MPKYADVRSNLATGDLVLFSGASWTSSLIRFAIGGKWSHVGLVVRTPAFPGRVMLWEATTLADLADVERGVAVAGVQLVPLSERLASYAGELKLRTLVPAATPAMQDALAEKRRELAGRPYEESKLELLRAAWDGRFGAARCERLHSLFCSELVAEGYQAMGLLPEPPLGLPSNEYTPRDFARRRVRLIGGHTLGRIVAVG